MTSIGRRLKRANVQDTEVAPSPRDGRAHRSGKEKHVAEARMQVVLYI